LAIFGNFGISGNSKLPCYLVSFMSKRALLYAVAIFLSSSLLFLVEPMAGKRLLPLLGGSAAVWTTCLVFFQTALLLGYLCAHAIATRVRPRMQAIAYGFLLIISLMQVALNLNPHPHASTARPIFSVLAVLAGLIGLPFLVLSATSSLLQAWYARGPAGSGGDGQAVEASRPPYRLFAISNFGSLLALVVYPAWVEPYFSLHAQTLAWSIGFLVFALVCGAISLGANLSAKRQADTAMPTATEHEEGPSTFPRQASESFRISPGGSDAKTAQDGAPSGKNDPSTPPRQASESFRISPVKSHPLRPIESLEWKWNQGRKGWGTRVKTAQDRAPLPGERTLWLLMAACGSLLLSAVTSHLSQNIAAIPLLWIAPLTIYLLTFVIAFNGKFYWRWLMVRLLPVALGSLGYFIAKPDEDLPIKISVPLFCLTLFIACLFCHGELYRRRPSPRYLTQYYLLIAAGGALGSMFVGVLAPFVFHGSYEMAWSLVYTAALASVVMWKEHWGWKLFWPAATLAMLAVVVLQVRAYGEDTIVQVRSFYGAMRVQQQTSEEGEMYRTLVHGTIQHGTQYFGSDDERRSPTTYYVHDSGIGLALDFCCQDKPRRVAVVGLGAGTLAAYGQAGDVFRFYEIDPRVETIAKNVFTYLRESKAKIEIVEGDARLSMEAEPPQQYDVIAVDAFSGDAIPVHLMTAEAVRLYQRHLRPGGILAFHISNTYLDLAPVVKAEAEHAGFPAVIVTSADDEYSGGYAADWVLVTANQEFLSLAEVSSKTANIAPQPGLKLWTDDYSSLWPVLKWRTRTVIQEKEEIDVPGK
jgi:spermidine synthase